MRFHSSSPAVETFRDVAAFLSADTFSVSLVCGVAVCAIVAAVLAKQL